jgi:cell wall-associated NlpC family hydrolase
VPTAARLATTLSIALVAALALVGGVAADPDKIDAKRAEAESVLSQIHDLDLELELAIDEWNGANVRLDQIEAELEVNTRRLEVAKASLRKAHATVERRLVTLYQGGEVDVVEVILGATSFDDLLDGLDTASRVAEDDARIAEEVQRSKAEVAQRQATLEQARKKQQEVVAQIAVLEEEEQQRQALLAAQAQRQAAAIERRQARAQTGQENGNETEPAPAPAPSPEPAPDPSPAPEPSPSPPPAGPGHPEVVPIALRYLGVPYRWGGASPSGFDCSGFTMYVYGKIGISLPHYVSWQWGYGRQVSRSQLAPGDLVFFNGLGHVGIYVGGGNFVHAPHTGDVVKISSIWDSWYRSTWVGGRRL